jgi:hypothetical protein
LEGERSSSLLPPSSLEAFSLRRHDIASGGFVISIQANRYITHIELLDEWV